jgi:hypothetical protein
VPGRLVLAARTRPEAATGGHWPLAGTHTGSPQQLLTTQVWLAGHGLFGPHVASEAHSMVPSMQIPLPLAVDAQMQSMLEEQGVRKPESHVSPAHPFGDPAA